MSKIGAKIVKEIREALPAMIFFLFLFHMIGLTKAIVIGDNSFTALRAAGATVGALIVTKAILMVEALPISRRSSGRKIFHILRKTLLYALMTLLFKFIEDLIHNSLKHGGVAEGINALFGDISWPVFTVVSLWIIGGLFLYCLVSELVRDVGRDEVREILFSKHQ